MIPYGKKDINQSVNSKISDLKSNFLSQGSLVPLFEKIVADYRGVRYGVVVNILTSALRIECQS